VNEVHLCEICEAGVPDPGPIEDLRAGIFSAEFLLSGCRYIPAGGNFHYFCPDHDVPERMLWLAEAVLCDPDQVRFWRGQVLLQRQGVEA